MRLKEKVAIVTGAAGGIGRAIALRLAEEGADMVIADINAEGANKVVKEINAMGGRGIVTKVDVTKSSEANRMAEAAIDKFAKIDILVNNAGGSARERNTLFHESEEAVWDYVIALNLKGTRNCTRAVVNHMLERRSGKIVNISSLAGIRGSSLGQADYAAAKAGIIGFTMALAKEVGGYGINVNCVSPAGIDSPGRARLSEEYRRKSLENIWLRRVGSPQEVSEAVLFLASEEANFITGQNLVVCGGMSLGF